MNLEGRMEALLRMSSSEKKAAWRETYRTPAPSAFGAGLLARAIAYRWQEKADAGLTREELRQQARLAVVDGKARDGKVAPTIKPGTWLSRTWHGEKHEVVVLDIGYGYLRARLAQYPGLTAQRLLREIAGRGYTGGDSMVRDEVGALRPAGGGKGFAVRFETLPGEQAQVDFAQFRVGFTAEPGVVHIVWLFSIVLGYSRLICERTLVR